MASAMVLIVIAVSLYFVPMEIYTENNKYYLDDNRAEEQVDVSDVNNNLNNINIIDNISCDSIIRYYDTYYGDTLYYVIKQKFNIEEITISVIVNEAFEFDWKNIELDKNIRLYDFIFEYKEEIVMSDVIGTVRAFGKIDCGTEQIYIEYSGISLDGTSNFVELVESMIVPK